MSLELETVKQKCSTLGPFETWQQVVDTLLDFGASMDDKDAILRCLIDQVQTGQTGACQSALLLAFWPGLCAIAQRRIGWNDHEDQMWPVLQHAFLSTVQTIDLSNASSGIAGALMRLTAAALRHDYRPEVTYESRRCDLIEMVDRTQTDDEARLRLAFARRRVSRAYRTRRVSADDLRLIRETELEGVPFEEAAQARGTTYEAIRKRRQRALDRLTSIPQKVRCRRRKSVP